MADDSLAGLAERVRQLEAGAGAGVPSYSPLSGLQVKPDGSIAYDFDGHVHAKGLDIDAGDAAAPRADRRVRWLRESDGALVADVAGSFYGSNARLDLVAHGDANAPAEPSGVVQLQVLGGAWEPWLGLFDGPNGTQITAAVPGNGFRDLIKLGGASSFLGYGGPTDLGVLQQPTIDARLLALATSSFPIPALAAGAGVTVGPVSTGMSAVRNDAGTPFSFARVFGSMQPNALFPVSWAAATSNVAGELAVTLSARNNSTVGTPAGNWAGAVLLGYV